MNLIEKAKTEFIDNQGLIIAGMIVNYIGKPECILTNQEEIMAICFFNNHIIIEIEQFEVRFKTKTEVGVIWNGFSFEMAIKL